MIEIPYDGIATCILADCNEWNVELRLFFIPL